MFTVHKITAGPLEPGKKLTLEFPYIGLNILSMEASCHCSTPINDTSKSKISVIFTAPNIPQHLALKGDKEYTSHKVITVKYTKIEDIDKQVFTKVLTFAVLVRQ